MRRNFFSNKTKYIFRIILNFLLWSCIPAYLFIIASFISNAEKDPLPSWNDGKSKKEIIEFVTRVTKEESPDFIPVEDRIAVFDNDGTLWPEQPPVEATFTYSLLKELSLKDSTLKQTEPYKSFLKEGLEYLKTSDIKKIEKILLKTHANKTEAELNSEIQKFLKTSKHPKYNIAYTQLAYLPMVELLNYLRENEFQTWICSGGSVNFIRAISKDMYGIPPQQVIGSYNKLEFVKKNNTWELWSTPEIISLNDKTSKPGNIEHQIGKTPVFVCGNERSGGDVAMLTYSYIRKGPSFQILINHDDKEREFYYQETDSISLKTAEKNHWDVVSIKVDWKEVYTK